MDIKNAITYKVAVPIFDESGYPVQNYIDLKIIPLNNQFRPFCAEPDSMRRWEFTPALRMKKPYQLFFLTRDPDGLDDDELSIEEIQYPTSILINDEELKFIINFLNDMPIRWAFNDKNDAGKAVMGVISGFLQVYRNKIDDKWIDNYINE